MASNVYLFRQRISRLGQVRPWEAPPLLSPCSPLTSRGHPSLSPPQCCVSGSTASAPPRGLPGPPPEARPSCPSTPPGCTVWSVPLCLRPAVLIVSPSFPQRMSSFQLNLNPLKEPLGFIKVLEWVSAVRADEAGNRDAAPAPVAARPAPSARRRGAKWGRGQARAGPEVAAFPGTGRDAAGWEGTRGRGLGLRGAGTPPSLLNR